MFFRKKDKQLLWGIPSILDYLKQQLSKIFHEGRKFDEKMEIRCTRLYEHDELVMGKLSLIREEIDKINDNIKSLHLNVNSSVESKSKIDSRIDNLIIMIGKSFCELEEKFITKQEEINSKINILINQIDFQGHQAKLFVDKFLEKNISIPATSSHDSIPESLQCASDCRCQKPASSHPKRKRGRPRSYEKSAK